IENQLDHKVKVIKCDNGTEFKNSVINQLCEIKGIRKEFSVARTPQQNGIAKRKNRTLIEAARTMLADTKLPTTDMCTDIAKISRKRSKQDNHEHKNGKENTRAGRMLSKVNQSQLMVNRSQP
ncbi:putative ribonuclease H-like domain-containing protein, partial [Tanacetum coccineum]